MADKENSVRLTRAQAKKRSAASLQAQPMASNPKRKRTALAEIPISTNVPAKPVTRMSKKKEEAKKAVLLPPAADEAVHSDLDDPQMCPHYATDIHQYLRSMEVRDRQGLILTVDLIWVLLELKWVCSFWFDFRWRLRGGRWLILSRRFRPMLRQI